MDGADLRCMRDAVYRLGLCIWYGAVALCIFSRGKTGALDCQGDAPLHEKQISIEHGSMRVSISSSIERRIGMIAGQYAFILQLA